VDHAAIEFSESTAVTWDVGDYHDTHPKGDQDVGARLARWALAKAYSQKDLVCSCPIYKSMKIEGGNIGLSFDHTRRDLSQKTVPPQSS
jgi:hypothetical protein